jgi:light-regulated signal transduction histidine kinase (bacteriophytochrome)
MPARSSCAGPAHQALKPVPDSRPVCRHRMGEADQAMCAAMTDLPATFGPVDLTNCDQEPIHIPGSIQPHGALITLDPRDMRIVHAGGDTETHLGHSVMSLLGASAADVFSPSLLARLRTLLATGRPMIRPIYVFPVLRDYGAITDVVGHLSDGLLVLEMETRFGPVIEDALALAQGMIRHVRQAGALPALLDAIAAEVRRTTGFDRVMVYRFAPDASGAVVAEARAPETDSFLGFNFPASDIPPQARTLYKANLIRTIPDARYEPALLLPPLNPLTDRPLDLSQSVLRSVSPVHRQYMANMGVVASMSLSLIARGQLWGLIACHHNTPRFLSHRLRDVCELFAEMTSAHLEMKLIEADIGEQSQARGLREELVALMSQEPDFANGLIRWRSYLLELIRSSGVGLWVGGRFSAVGTAPTPEQAAALVDWLNAEDRDGVFHTDSLPVIYPPARAYSHIASGLLALSVSRTPRDYVLWFRPEISPTVKVAGHPVLPVDQGQGAPKLTPRNSFAAWLEATWRVSVRLHACPWLTSELDTAQRLRMSLLEVVLRQIDQTVRAQELARLAQEKLAKLSDQRLEEWRTVAEALKRESERRAILEADLSQLLRRTVADQEAERVQLARELHDTLGQSLTLLQLGLEGIGRVSTDSDGFQVRLAALKDITVAFGSDINRLAWEIRPTALDDLGIQQAIRNLVETWSERAGIQFDLHLTLDQERLPPEVETTLYRVLQEALTNIVRHAGASRVGVVLWRADKIVSMIVEDNGRGFVNDETGLDSQPAKRLGLLGIRERLALVDGSLEIESALGKGTTLFIRIPI